MSAVSEDRIEVVPYDPRWPAAFKAERRALLGAFGGGIQLVEHIGSTALPGLAAKPTIDIMVGARELRIDASVTAPMERLGYRYLGEYGIPGRHFFRKGEPPTHHVHWVERGEHFWDVQVLFRDYMLAHADESRAYEELKRSLAKRYRKERAKYTAAKTEFVEAILEKARAWRRGRTRPVIVFDLEATCWENDTYPERQEIIEIGAVRLAPETLEPGERFMRFVRPTREPKLSEFCRKLTSITQAQVDAARAIESVLPEFAAWMGDGPLVAASWGDYDLKQIRVDCKRQGRPVPAAFAAHLNLRRLFADGRGSRPCAMPAALEQLGLPFAGVHHRGIDDAVNTAEIARVLLAGRDLAAI